MHKYSKTVLICRSLSFILLFAVVQRYVSPVLPVFVPPLWTLFLTAAVAFFHKKQLNAPAAFAGSAAAAVLTVFLPLFVLYLLPFRYADILYLRLSSISGILTAAAAVMCLSTVLFFYTGCWNRYEPLFCIGLMVLLFKSQSGGNLTVISHTVLAASAGLFFILLQIVLLCAAFLTDKRFVLFALGFFALMLLLAGLLTQGFNKAAAVYNGGLLEQKLFNFDFSEFLTLQDEVKMNSNLVMIVHVEKGYSYHLFRRMYLSGWNRMRGFYEKAAPHEKTQLLRLPSAPTAVPHTPFFNREKVTQEIFTVNLDSSTFISLDYPVHVTPYTVWDTLAFKSAYKTESEVLPALLPDVFASAFPSGNDNEGLSARDLAFYTAVDSETTALLKPVAKAVTAQCGGYYDKIYALLEYFREGDYRYSLQPGKAPDGNQLRYFIEETKKGYCTYFAFSYCLMLRSIGIPARVAAGFFLHPETGILDYYPVRANMAHAWVEVFFPYLGWVSFDPTTQHLAEGQTADFSFEAGGTQFNSLLHEILSKRSELQIQNKTDTAAAITSFSALLRRYLGTDTGSFILIFTLLGVFAVLLRVQYPYAVIRFSKNNRKIILMLKKKHPHASEAFNALVQKAKFAPVCTQEDVLRAKTLFKTEKKRRTAASKLFKLFKRFKLNRHAVILICVLLPFFRLPAEDAEQLLRNAERALTAENWDTAASILKNGIKTYPSNEIFHLKLGDMYYNNGLYELAYRFFTEGLKINRHNIKLLYGASNAAAALNYDETARILLQEYLAYNPADIFVWATYGWLCFKTHKDEEGIQAMLNARSNYGDDGSLSNALGNLYGGLFDYPQAKHAYTRGIELALQNDAPYSASVYAYNKAILETSFYRFSEAEEDARNALEYFPRSSGYLMLGELEERKNNFERALYYYVKAAEENYTPLPLLSLAKLYLRAGHPEKGETYLAAVKRVSDYSWLSNFGMSAVNFYAELYGLYAMLYKLKYAAEKIRLPESLSGRYFRWKNLLYYRSMMKYYTAREGIAYINVAKEYEGAGVRQNPSYELYKNNYYYRAFQHTPYKARRYLKQAEKIETAFIPQAQGAYTAELGILQRHRPLLEEALRLLDPVWEKEQREAVLAALIDCTAQQDKKNAFAEELFKSNPACFLLYGLRLPVRLAVRHADSKQAANIEARLRSALKKTLFTISEAAPFVLTLTCGETAAVQLTGTDGQVYYRSTEAAYSGSKQQAVRLTNRLCSRLFRKPLGNR